MLVLKFQQMAWYKMSKRNQLSYAHLLNRLQNGTKLRMGPFAELNFETFTDVISVFYIRNARTYLFSYLYFCIDDQSNLLFLNDADKIIEVNSKVISL